MKNPFILKPIQNVFSQALHHVKRHNKLKDFRVHAE